MEIVDRFQGGERVALDPFLSRQGKENFVRGDLENGDSRGDFNRLVSKFVGFDFLFDNPIPGC